jgi:hypothetical protein
MAKKEFLDFQFSDIPFQAFAIHTTLSLHLFAWNIDSLMGTNFTLDEPFVAEIKKVKSEHRRFIHKSPEVQVQSWILENKGVANLFQSKPLADFLLILKDLEDESFFPDLKNVMKSIAGVSIVYPIAEQEKNKLHWVADLMFEEDTKEDETFKKTE